MKAVKAGHEHISHVGVNPYEFLEKIGRVCYHSEDQIAEGTAVPFVQGIYKRKHFSVLAHEWVHLYYIDYEWDRAVKPSFDYLNSLRIKNRQHSLYKFLEITQIVQSNGAITKYFVSAPLRLFIELWDLLESESTDVVGNCTLDAKVMLEKILLVDYADLFSDLNIRYRGNIKSSTVKLEDFIGGFTNEAEIAGWDKELIDAEIMRHVPHTVCFTCDRGVTHELVRHTQAITFSHESTRYCNYTKDKFGNEITFIEPFFFAEDSDNSKLNMWKHAMMNSEQFYLGLSSAGCSPQQARSVLPNSLMSRIVATCNEVEWQHIVNVRYKGMTGKPHPQMEEIMTPWYADLKVLSEGRIE